MHQHRKGIEKRKKPKKGFSKNIRTAQIFFYKLYKWEFWPFWIFYIPVYFYWLYLSLRARSLFFFSAANPLMELGGLVFYSKYNVLKNIPERFVPKMIFIETAQQRNEVKDLLENAGLVFPLISKPDVGERGKKVKKIHSLEELKVYFSHTPDRLILQEFIDYPLELGVMYIRLPDEKKGKIYSLVQKKFLTVRGNGQENIAQLLEKDFRSAMYLDHLEKNYPDLPGFIPKFNEEIVLEPIGNHCRGTIFLNVNHLISLEMEGVFDEISRQIPGFYFGRFDIKIKNLSDLYTGENIKIMELNGANSEPAHIYDPRMPIHKAYSFLFRHWEKLYQISVQNHRLGYRYPSTKEILLLLWQKFRSPKTT